MQTTIQKEISCQGVGLHSGKLITMTLCPAGANTGIVFDRVDVESRDNLIPAQFDNVVDTRLCTVIANEDGVCVGTIEHVMSALRGCGVDNVLVKIDGAEVPVLDGSAMPFVALIQEVGVEILNEKRHVIRILKDVVYEEDGKSVSLKPYSHSAFSGTIEFDQDVIGTQKYSVELLNGNFVHDIAAARTFCFERDVLAMRANGLALGGSMENAIVLSDTSVLNAEGLRFSDEFIRHKLLDAIGDLYLAGHAIQGAYDSHKAGHYMNNQLLRTLFSDPSNYEIVAEAV